MAGEARQHLVSTVTGTRGSPGDAWSQRRIQRSGTSETTDASGSVDFHDPLVPLTADTNRVLRNRTLLRNVNERINDLNVAVSDFLPRGGLICECGRVDCLETFHAPLEVFAAVSRSHGCYLVIPEHLITAFDEVVEKHDDWWVVEVAHPWVDDGRPHGGGVCGTGDRGPSRGRGLATVGENAAARHNGRRGH
jgi:hypothetical protein